MTVHKVISDKQHLPVKRHHEHCRRGKQSITSPADFAAFQIRQLMEFL